MIRFLEIGAVLLLTIALSCGQNTARGTQGTGGVADTGGASGMGGASGAGGATGSGPPASTGGASRVGGATRRRNQRRQQRCDQFRWRRRWRSNEDRKNRRHVYVRRCNSFGRRLQCRRCNRLGRRVHLRQGNGHGRGSTAPIGLLDGSVAHLGHGPLLLFHRGRRLKRRANFEHATGLLESRDFDIQFDASRRHGGALPWRIMDGIYSQYIQRELSCR
jgi:hypothetical protein